MKEEKKLMLQENESERGATMVEYALVVALIATVCIVGFTKLGSSVNKTLGDANTGIGAAANVASQIGGQVKGNMAAAASGNEVTYTITQ